MTPYRESQSGLLNADTSLLEEDTLLSDEFALTQNDVAESLIIG
jgi:hypothetical protein